MGLEAPWLSSICLDFSRHVGFPIEDASQSKYVFSINALLALACFCPVCPVKAS